MFFQKEKDKENNHEANEVEVSTILEKGSKAKTEIESKRYRTMTGAYIVGVSGLTAIIAGVVTSHLAKKKGQEYFKDLEKRPKLVMESPTSLALRALAWATVISVGFCSLTVFGIWKWYNIKDLDDLRTRIRKYTRKSTKSEGRTEFENLSDFLTYLDEMSQKKTNTKDA